MFKIANSQESHQSFHKSTVAKSQKDKKRNSNFDKPHMIIPVEDMEWVLKQKPSVNKLWQECWVADAYGSRWMQLNTSLKHSAFSEAKKILEEQGLFIFKADKSITDSRQTVCWLIKNLHGSRVKEFWKESAHTDCKSTNMESKSAHTELESAHTDCISTQTFTQQGFQNLSVSSQKHLSNSSKELLRCEESTSLAPFKGAEASDSEENLREEGEVVHVAAVSASAAPGETFVSNQELTSHLEAAKEGIKPSDEVIEQLRNSDYWVGFRQIATTQSWDLSKWFVSTMSSEAQERMRSLKEKMKNSKRRF